MSILKSYADGITVGPDLILFAPRTPWIAFLVFKKMTKIAKNKTTRDVHV
jgi:hypothetical protein